MKNKVLLCCTAFLLLLSVSSCADKPAAEQNATGEMKQSETVASINATNRQPTVEGFDESLSTENDSTEPEASPTTHSQPTAEDSNVFYPTEDNSSGPETVPTTNCQSIVEGSNESSPTEYDLSEPETAPTISDKTNNSQKDNEMDNNYKLLVIGKDVTAGNYMNFYDNPHYVALPFTAVLEALGAGVEWKSDVNAQITFNGEKYMLDMEAGSFVKEGSSINYIIPAPGSRVYYQIVGNEFVLDHITVRTVAMMMGIKIRVIADFQNHIVEIDYL